MLDSKADHVFSGSLAGALGKTPCVLCTVTSELLKFKRVGASRAPLRSYETQVRAGAGVEVGGAVIRAKRALTRELAVAQARRVTSSADAALGAIVDGARGDGTAAALELTATALDRLLKKGEKATPLYTFVMVEREEHPDTIGATARAGGALVYPPAAGGYRLGASPR